MDIAGNRVVTGGNNLVNGHATVDRLLSVRALVESGGFGHSPGESRQGAARFMSREEYASIYGPTTGDCVVNQWWGMRMQLIIWPVRGVSMYGASR